MTSAFDFSFAALKGGPLPLAQFRGRPLVVVNTASQCGFTPQYAALQTLWRTHRDDGLVVLGVPCNDFGGQEPGDATAISAFCMQNYSVDFPLTAKVHVRGAETHPLFRWLAQEGGFLSRPRWNFYKYLIGRDGQLHDWFGSITPPSAGRFTRAVGHIVGK
jgi:glutathione peroxidase